jgi:hypothetical protein
MDPKDPSKSLKSNIIKGVNKEYLSLIVSNLISGATVRFRKSVSSKSTLHWIVEYMKHKLKVNVSVFNDSRELSLKVIDYLFPEDVLNNIKATPVEKYNLKIRHDSMTTAFFQSIM